MEGWKEYKFGGVVNINSDSITSGYPHKWIKYLDTSSVTDNIFHQPISLELSKAPSRAKRIVKSNSILYSTVRPNLRHFGYIKAASDNLIASTGFAVITGKPITDTRFLFYWLTQESIIKYLTALAEAQTTTFPAINPSEFSDLDIDLPPLPLQHRIAEILGALDDKIELNRQMNQTLEQIAQTMYKHYFVDDIDPDNLPEGWRNGVLGEIFNITMGQSPDGKSYNMVKAGILFFQGRTDFGFRFPEARMYTSEPTRYAKKFDTLVSVRAPVGDINIAHDDCCVGRGLAAVQHKTIKPSFTFYTLKSLKNDFDTFNGEGTVFGSINKDDFNRIPIVIPSNLTLTSFEGLANPLDDLIFTNHNEILNLTLIRDFWLPKLISGDLIPSALQTIEQAL